MKIYGQGKPPAYPLENIVDFPVALFGGSLDVLGHPTDVDWLNQKLGETVVFYKTYYLGHMSFAIAKEMTWFAEDAVNLLN